MDRLRDEYERWDPYDPDGPSATEVAGRHGVSKNTMYTWRARGWRLDGREGDGHQGWKPRGGEMTQEHDQHADLSEVVRYLTDELVKAKVRIRQLEDELAQNANEHPVPKD